jgi:flap endonuclease-1
MGVKIKDLIIGSKLNLSQLQKKIIAIDAPNIIFSFFTFSYKNKQINSPNLIVDRTQRVISHLYGIFYRINFYYANQILPIFCFDGIVSELKRIVSKDHLNDYRVVKEWYEDALRSGNTLLARKISLGKEFLWPNIINESKQLINLLGVPILDSPASAESQCAYLVKNNMANYANSQDFDSLVFGCPYIIQNLSKSLRRKVQGKWIYKKIEPTFLRLETNLKRLNIDQFQLVDLAILIGTDYNQGVKNVGPKTALELIKKYDNLENVIDHESNQYQFDHLTTEVIQEIRKIFLFPDVLEKSRDLYWDPPNRSQIIKLLCKNHNLNKERVDKNFKKLTHNYYKCISTFKNKIPRKLIQKTLDMSF